MPYNGSGSFTVNGSYFPAVAGALIESAKYNGALNDIAAALSTAVTKDGQTTITANLPMSGFRHTGVSDGATRTDYASVGQMQDNGGKWAGTAGGTANAITLTLAPAISAYAAGQEFVYKSGAAANTSTMTVAVSGLTTKAIQKNGVAMASGDHPANAWLRITYDGTAFQLQQILQPSGFMLSVLDDTTAAAALTTLGVSTFVQTILNDADAATVRTTVGAVGLTGTENVAGQKTFTTGAAIKGGLGSASIAAGYIGENQDINLVEGSAVALTTGISKTILTRSLTAGKWEVGGIVNFTFGATTQVLSLFGGASLVTDTLDGYGFSHRCSTFTPGAVVMGYTIPPREIDIDVTTSVYLVALAGFVTSTCSAWGYLRIRRIG